MNILSAYTPQNYNLQGSNSNRITQSASLQTSPKNTRTSIFYVNDVHGQIPKMERIAAASHIAGIEAEQSGAGLLRLCSGDTFIGSDRKRNETAARFLDITGFDATTIGNHEFDITASICGDLLKNSKTNVLAMNLNYPDNNSELAKKTMRSMTVTDANGERYGLIGLQPSDLVERIGKSELLEGITVDDAEQTKKELQAEVNALREQGINKIIVISHEGNEIEKELAQSIDGVDVILGGHSHDLIEDVKDGENLFYSPSGEPVVITQAGRDGNNFGLLNLEFNDKGQIVFIQNNIRNTNDYAPNLVMSKTTDEILGVSPEIGTLSAVKGLPSNIMKEENPWADFVADAVKTGLDTEIVLINSANFRGSVAEGSVKERDITSIFPFSNNLVKTKISEKNLVEAVKTCAKKSLTSTNSKPGILQVSGLRYTMTQDGDLKSMTFIDKNGNEHPINIDNPDPNKTYIAAYDEFLVSGGDGLDMLIPAKEDIIQEYDFDKDKPTIDYIKAQEQPFEVKTDGRITVESLQKN